MLPATIENAIRQKSTVLWLNDAWQPIGEVGGRSTLGLEDVRNAERRLGRYRSLLATLFPELRAVEGDIESTLKAGDALPGLMLHTKRESGRWLMKADHELPLAGSIKARGGFYEILAHAESLAIRSGLMRAGDDPSVLLSPRTRACFASHRIAVGSTGNLGVSIGLIGAALGFQVDVHMSRDAKRWKQERLRNLGVTVLVHEGDYTTAVSSARELAKRQSDTYFVDDENSLLLFLGYSVAALRLQAQLSALGVPVDSQNPLFVYLPCGIGGAPGGITFGLRHLFGDHFHCFFAEPVACPSMLVRLATRDDRPRPLSEMGLDGKTDADGLAVTRASELVASLVQSLVSGIFTVPDEHLFEDLYRLHQSEGERIEPSAAAAFRGPDWILSSEAGHEYLSQHSLLSHLSNATHILWTTGGALVPRAEFEEFIERGRCLARQRTEASSLA